VDNYTGVQIFGYDGKLISYPKIPGLRAEFITTKTIALTDEIVAVKDRSDEKGLFSLFKVSGIPV
jgi:intraflagellar transport protein 80